MGERNAEDEDDTRGGLRRRLRRRQMRQSRQRHRRRRRRRRRQRHQRHRTRNRSARRIKPTRAPTKKPTKAPTRKHKVLRTKSAAKQDRKQQAKETIGFVAGGLEGEAPVIVAHVNDVYVLTTFQGLWRFDATQIIPCGNVLGFFQPAFAKWSVTVTFGKTSRKIKAALQC